MGTKTTDVETIKENEIIEGLENLTMLTIEEVYRNIFDLSLPLNNLLDLVKIYNSKVPEEVGNVINRLNSMYVFSFSKVIENYLFRIIHEIDIDTYLKLESAKVLTYNTDRGYQALNYICSLKDNPIATLCKVESICYLTRHPDYLIDAYRYLHDIISDLKLDCLYRYQIILSLYRQIDDKELKIDFTKRLCISFLQNEKNLVTGRILASQNLLINCNPDEELTNYIEGTLLNFGMDESLNENVRADSIDVLMQYGRDDVRKIAARLIVALGTRQGKARTIFDNSQNVHHRSIEESANKILEYLNTIPNKNRERVEIDFDHVRKEILEDLKLGEDEKNFVEFKEKIEMSLTRVFLDRAVYSQYNMTLMNILVKMWCYIDNHSEYREVMRERLLEELADASEVCSTGYAFRIVNVLSGFGEMSITISFEDQIVANLEGRLNAKIREITDEDFMMDVLAEMAIPAEHYDQRGNFLRFFRGVISTIREDMYQEFKDWMSDTDYDLNFRKALFHYEGYN